MSSNRLRYDTCAYKAELTQGTNMLSYLLDPMKFENCKKCRMELGVVGGNEVSQIKGNLVDLENDLRGQTRLNTKCPSKKFQWNAQSGVGGSEPSPVSKDIFYPKSPFKNELRINTEMKHLPPCQMIRYDPVPLPPPLDLPKCMPPAHKMNFA